MDRTFFLPHALEVAPRLLGVHLSTESPEGIVTVRITEVEAYHGVGVPGVYDAGSHSRDRKTERNASMFGPPGHAYVYFTYGMHHAVNLVCSPEGIASGVLIRSGEIIEGAELARERRHQKRGSHGVPDRQLARGPGNLATALGITRETHDGRDVFVSPFHIADPQSAPPPPSIATGPRVGVAGVAGGPEFPWRFWELGNPSVSAFRPGRGAPRPNDTTSEDKQR